MTPKAQMVQIPPGEFVMGETTDDKFADETERPAHRVTIPAFAIARFPVTCREYRAFAPDHSPDEDPALPVVNVSWQDAQSYCVWLTLQTGHPYRLPTEPEWEYACRAGSRTPFAWGSEITPANANFLHDENCLRVGPGQRTPEGAYPPNAFGLYDMHGNVCEWVEDPWRPNYLTPPVEAQRVIRGGAWDYMPRLIRSAWRDWLQLHHRRDNVGFRLASPSG